MSRYHGKCLKIARGKIKEDDKYTCPICDHRVKIPRDAARPKLEDLQDWQAEISTLPFQPEEEDTLEEIVSCAQDFRDWVRPYTNPLLSLPDEVSTHRFYLRKIEGADILLAFETNFFRQELHKWAPVAPDAPPILEYSHSTRKPRPTKQQKMMAQLGITNPDELPQQFRTKQQTFSKSRKSSDSHSTKAPQPLQPAPQYSQGSETPTSLPLSASSGTVFSTTHSHRLPNPISTAHPEAGYTAFFTSQSPRSGQTHGDYGGNPSPTFAWQNRLPPPHHSPRFMNSPDFRPVTPLHVSSSSGPPPPLDPGLFSPTSHHFAASALLRDAVSSSSSAGPHSASALVSPMLRDGGGGGYGEPHDGRHSRHGSSTTTTTAKMGDLFADFTTEVVEDPGRNEAGEALEALGEEFLNPSEDG